MKYLLFALSFLLCANACKEEGRYEPERSGNPPGKVSGVTYEPLYGGVKLFYTVPADEDLLQVEAEYTNEQNQTFLFSSSFYKDSLSVYGFSDVKEYTVSLYAVNRNGVRSEPVNVMVTPLEPAYTRVAKSIDVKPGFSSFLVDWENELQQNINVYIDFSYTQDGTSYSFTNVFSSNLETDRRFVNDLYLSSDEPVHVKIRVEDSYGNITETMDQGQFTLLEDIRIPKENWVLPNANDSIGGIPMCFGDGLEGRNRYVIDDVIDRGDNLNFMHTNSRGRTGRSADGNMPWNFIIDLGDYYELSRIITVQRHSGGLANVNRGQYYQSENVGIFRLYIWDDETNSWSGPINEHTIPVPMGLSEIEFVRLGEAGDMAYFYPDNPQYTKPTRWFRYEAVKGFSGNYTLEDANCLSEITLFGRKANK
ncbi:MAG TPA: DUF4959 domain-containing protein [Porphyromonadaceae bacterium]|nr:DUF4959 domain-containing protein [Porphyromonadaceae bacterium]